MGLGWGLGLRTLALQDWCEGWAVGGGWCEHQRVVGEERGGVAVGAHAEDDAIESRARAERRE